MAFETEQWPFLKARQFKDVKKGRIIKYIVIHTPESPEADLGAENVARYFTTAAAGGATHLVVDNNSVVQCVLDHDIAYGAKGGNINAEALHVEMMGYAGQSKKQWLDNYSIANIAITADKVAQWCLKFDIIPRRLSDAELLAGKLKGIIGHDQVTRVFKVSGGHTDPGPNFPWPRLMSMITIFAQERASVGV
jgi:N-acetyl-anhydromuramyl-L-alanine amidase AmpD